MGAGSTVFAKSVLGDCMLKPCINGATIALYDIDSKRLEDSRVMVEALNQNLNAGTKVESHLGVENRKAALDGADFVVNAIQVGGYEPSTVIDFEIPKKYGLRQTIGDTLGIGGIFRALRTIPVVNSFGEEMTEVCPNATFLNYVNPMGMITGAFQQTFDIQSIGLCHSVQVCASHLLRMHSLESEGVRWNIAGINHMAWLLEIERDGKDLYPYIKDSYRDARKQILEMGGAKAVVESAETEQENDSETERLSLIALDMVRHEIMLHFGCYVTESSEHNAEYAPYWIRKDHPELVDRFAIPLDEYPRRCKSQIEHWEKQRKKLVDNPEINHEQTNEYASKIIEAIVEDKPFRAHGNVLNKGHLISNLPENSCVELPCLIDHNGITPGRVGKLPEACAALNRTNINVQLLTIEAALNGSRDALYQAALLDPHTSCELSIDEIVSMCNDLIEAHGDMLPQEP